MAETQGDSLLERSLRHLSRVWRDLVPPSWRPGAGIPRPDLPDEDLPLLRERIRACLQGPGGELSARRRTAELGRTVLGLNEEGRRRFLTLVAEELDVDREKVDAAMEAVRQAEDATRSRAEAALRDALHPPRLGLLARFNTLPEGVKFLVDLRAELLPIRKQSPRLRSLDDDLERLLASWFDEGFLELRRIDWEAPASLLEKLIDYEAVHAIRSWEDLRNRLESDRRCYAFFHPRMPEEPLIFVEVALTKGLAGDVVALLDEGAPAQDPREADTAIFYSINNTQRGLRGISFGNFLIKRVVDDLLRDLPHLKTFSTLSPIPGFGTWLREREAEGEELLGEKERARVAEALDRAEAPVSALLDDHAWAKDDATAGGLREAITSLGARYLLHAKRRGRPADPVARFHLGNGARIERINWLGNRAPEGLRQSAGLMVNYLYELGAIEANHEAFAVDGTIVASGAVQKAARR